MILRQKKKYPTFCPDVKHAPMVSPGHNIVASFILEIIPLQVSCKTMIGDQKLHRACVFSHAAIRLIERKKKFYVRKKFNSHRIGLRHQHGCLFIKQLLFRNPKVTEITSCENALLAIFSTRARLDRCSVELHYGNQL